MNWKEISKQPELSESFIREHAKELHWETICVYQTLSESFIQEMNAYVSWETLSRFQPLSFDFIQNHKDVLSYTKLKQNPLLPFTQSQWNDLFPIEIEKEIQEKFSSIFSNILKEHTQHMQEQHTTIDLGTFKIHNQKSRFTPSNSMRKNVL